ncbi:hypothetical protein ACFQX6_09845 [Streptosporangium lutulentum]
MTAAVLALYAVVAVVAVPGLLNRGEWTERAPRLAICVWLAACVSVIASAVFSVLAVAIPANVIGHGLAEVFQACATMLFDGAILTSPSSAPPWSGPL